MLPTCGYSNQTGHPHIEVGPQSYCRLVLERGTTCERFVTTNIDELLYQVFFGVTHDLADNYGLFHRNPKQDSRRTLFQYQVELLAMLSPKWFAKKSQEHEHILRQYPFDDVVNVRAAFAQELTEQGHTLEAVWQMACERYPLHDRIDE